MSWYTPTTTYVKVSLLASVVVVMGLWLGGSVEAAPNFEINYQGKITASTGVPVADGSYNMEFVLYDEGGTPQWTETLNGANQVLVTNGLFSVMLGSTTALTGVDFNQTLYLGVNFNGDGEMTPRKILGTVPAAFIAEDANTFGGLATTSFLRSNQDDTASGYLTFTGGASSTNLIVSNWATTTNLRIAGGLYDSGNFIGTSGLVLQSTGTSTRWMATSSLGFNDHDSVTLAGALDYLTLSGQEITLNTVDISDDTNFSVDATGLSLSNDAIDLTAGYNIPLIASTTDWNNFYTTPSTRITAGDGIEWSTNTLNVNDVTAAMLVSGDFGDFSCNGTICTFDDDTIGTAEIADADFGAFTFSGGVATLDAGTVSTTTLTATGYTDEYILIASSTVPGGYTWVATSSLGISSAADDLSNNFITDLSDVDTSGAVASNILTLTSAGDWVDVSTSTFLMEDELSTEAELYGLLSDVTQFWEAGDALSSGSITSGFGNIDIGSSNFDADGTITFGGLINGGFLTTNGSGVLSTSTIGVADLTAEDFGDFTVSGGSATLDNDVISPDNVLAAGQTDEYCLTYESTGDTWAWQDCSAGSVNLNDLNDVDTTGVATSSILALNSAGIWVDVSTSTFLMTYELDSEGELETQIGGLDVLTISADDVTSANLITAVSDETGSGNLVFSTSPSLTTPTVSTSLTVTDDDWIGLGSGAGRLIFDDQTTDTISFMDANIGIGTSTPQRQLTLATEGSDGGLLIKSYTDDAFFDLDSGSGVGDFSAITFYKGGIFTNQIYTGDNTDNNLYIDTSTQGGSIIIEGGFVGVEDTTPSAQLNVGNGNVASVDGVGDLFVTDDIELAGDIYVDGFFMDSDNSSGTPGWILQTTATGTHWIATTSLGIASHDPVTLAGGLDYLTLSGQQITLGQIDVSDDTNFNVTATGLGLSGDALTLTGGYNIPLIASTTDWNNFYTTPSTRITAGDGIEWSTNTLNVNNVTGAMLADADFGAFTISTGLASLDDNVVHPDDVLSTGQQDEYCLTYESTGDTWAWEDCSAGAINLTDLGDVDTSGVAASNIIALNSAGNWVDVSTSTFTTEAELATWAGSANITTVGALNSGSITSGFGNIDIGASNLDADGTVTFGGISDGIVQAVSGALSATGTVSDSYISDTLTIGAGGSVDDGALSANVSLLGADVGPTELTSTDFGDFSCNGTTCTFDDDTIGTAEIADADFGAFTFSGGVATLDAGTVSTTTLTATGYTDEYILIASSTVPGGYTWVATSSLGFAAEGSLHDSVTLAGALDYLTLSGQEITLNTVDISDDTNLSVDATGLSLSNDAIDLTAGYNIPLIASTTDWNNFYTTPSTRITAGDGIEWSTNTLNVNNVTGAMLADADFGAFTFSGGVATLDTGTVSTTTLTATGYTDEYILIASSTVPGGYTWVATSSLGFADTTLDENTVEGYIFDTDSETITGNWEVQDDVDFTFGNDADWNIQYDEAVDNQLLFVTTNTGAQTTGDPMVQFLVGTTPAANQQVFGVAKGTQGSNTDLFTVDEDGDVNILGIITNATWNGDQINDLYISDSLSIDNTGSVDSTALTDGGTIGFDWVDGEVADDLTISASGTIDPQAMTLATGNVLIGDASNNAIATSSLYVSSSGNIGVGTTSPLSLLDVWGNMRLGTTSDGYLSFGTNVGTSSYGFRNLSGNLQFKNSGGTWSDLGSGGGGGGGASFGTTEQIPYTNATGDDFLYNSNFVFDGTNLGIGLSNPDKVLDVVANTSDYAIEFQNSHVDGWGQYIYVNNNDDARDAFHIQTTAGDPLVVENDGDVGIMDNDPDFRFEVNGSSGNGYFGITNSTDGDILTVNGSGFMGIGTTTPSSRFTVDDGAVVNGIRETVLIYGDTYPTLTIKSTDSSGGNLRLLSSEGEYQIYAGTGGKLNFYDGSANRVSILNGGDVGIGTTTPNKRLQVLDTVSDDQFRISYDATRYADFQVDSVGDLVVDAQGGDVRLNDENLWVCASGSCPSGSPAGTGNAIIENSLGVGTSSPREEVEIWGDLYVANSNALALGQATSTFQGDVMILGKLDVGTIDPIYRIDGIKYATYGMSSIGVKEEAASTLKVTEYNEATGYYEKRIAWNELERASDLWLFRQITDFGLLWEYLTVSLTAGFDGRVFYTKDVKNQALVIQATAPGEVSVRFLANRFDWRKWGNVRPDQDGEAHFELEEVR